MMPAPDAAAGMTTAMPAEHEQSGSSRSGCTDCSYCASRPRMRTRAGVRVRLNLRQFFSDQRARAFMWAPYGRCVQWLGRRVARVFGLPDDIALMSRGHILPVFEPLLMLDHDDLVEVVNMSYVFTSHDKPDDPNITSHRIINETSVLTDRVETHNCQIQSNVIIKQKNTSQLPTGSRADNLTEHENLLRLSPIDVETTMRSPESQNMDESEDLQRLKQRALNLLDEHCHMLHEASAPKRMRRRRRRRRKILAPNNALEASDDDEPQLSGTAVLRNGSGARPPRLVRALSPSPVAHMQSIPIQDPVSLRGNELS